MAKPVMKPLPPKGPIKKGGAKPTMPIKKGK